MMTLFMMALMWAILGWTTAHFAKKRGRDPLVWFAIGMLFGLLGLGVLFLLPSKKEQQIQENPFRQAQEATAQVLEDDWYCLDQQHQQLGPMSGNQLRELWEEQKIGEHSYVWREGMKEWRKIGEVEGLRKKLERECHE